MTQTIREANELVEEFEDGSGYRYEIKATFGEKKPILIISQGGDTIVIRAADWMVVKDCADRALEYIGEWPDDVRGNDDRSESGPIA